MTGSADARQVDVLIVGAGAAGAIVAAELAKGGAHVVVLDKGSRFDTQDDFALKHDEIRYYARGAIVPHVTTDPMTWRPDAETPAEILPWVSGPLGTANPLHLPPSLGTGGGSVHWGGACWRFRESEFRMKSTIVERLGESALPDNHTLVDWPLEYADLEPYYDRAEWELGISGQASNLDGEVRADGNPWEAPRARDYPMPPLRTGAADATFARACRGLGYHPFRAAAAIASRPFKGRPACTYCGFCHGYPCHVDAKTSTHVTGLPEGLASGNLEIRDHCRVYAVRRTDDGRRVTGVSYFDPDGVSVDLDADTVVLAAYSLENARLLLSSGINGNGQVGRHYMTHAFGFSMGTLPQDTNPFMGPLVAASAIEDFSGELIQEQWPGVLWGAPIISWTGDYQPIEVAHAMPGDAPRWGAGFKHWMHDNYRRLWAMYSQTANIPTAACYVDLDPTVTDRFGQPALRMTHAWAEHDRRAVAALLEVKRRIAAEMGLTSFWEEETGPDYHLSTHECGTHRMGEDPRTSVVDRFGRSHECDNLFVIGGGQFPTYHGYNPTQTIWALAYLTTDHMLDRSPAARAPNSSGGSR